MPKGKRRGESWCLGNSPATGLEALPIVDIAINGRRATALLDTGCSRTVIATWVCEFVQREKQEIVSADGRRVKCAGTANVELRVYGKVVTADCVVVHQLFEGVDAVLGMDVLTRMGGITIGSDGVRLADCQDDGRDDCVHADNLDGRRSRDTCAEKFEKLHRVGDELVCEERAARIGGEATVAASPMAVENQDFSAHFDGSKWTVSWTWKHRPPELKKRNWRVQKYIG